MRKGECAVAYQWTTELPSGLIVVTKEDGSQFVPTLTAARAVNMDRVYDRWGPMVRRLSNAYGLPRWQWGAAMIYQESLGNERAFRQERHADGTPIVSQPSGRPLTGVGLMQITSEALKGHYTDEQLYDPELNIRIGLSYIRNLYNRYGDDFPKLSAAFNAGSVRPSDKNPWGMYCYGSHVDSEVSAMNYAILRELDEHQVPMPLLIDMVDLARTADDAARENEPDPAA